jgi:putative FmdB family regulatory protein
MAASANAAREESVPTYQYACTDCGDRSEVVQRFTDEPLTVCSACGGKLRKVFSPVGIVFKGSGFYRNDSRDSSSSKSLAGANGSSSNGSSSNGDSGSTDSGSSASGEKKEDKAASKSSSSDSSSSSSTSASGSKVA